MSKPVALIGYSGHSFVALEILRSMGMFVEGYCDIQKKELDPFRLNYLGTEADPAVLTELRKFLCFVSIGDNRLREKLSTYLSVARCEFINAIHPRAFVSDSAKVGQGVMIGPGAIINALAIIAEGVICNSGSVIEHECKLDSFVHVAPGAVLCGNVTVGARTLIGAGAVIRPNVKIGMDVIIGAGSMVLRDVPDNSKVVGNPHRSI
jgi:sugar O-acyltransferase (sialic acid O-acetyltransferase NeuD family)